MLTQEQQSKVLALVDEYLEIRKRPDFDEQYKFDFFKKDHPDLIESQNLIEDWKAIKKEAKNLVPYDLRQNLFIHLILRHELTLKNLLRDLYGNTGTLAERVDAFESAIFNILTDDPEWKNNDMAKMAF